jgi:hypothetical protein
VGRVVDWHVCWCISILVEYSACYLANRHKPPVVSCTNACVIPQEASSITDASNITILQVMATDSSCVSAECSGLSHVFKTECSALSYLFKTECSGLLYLFKTECSALYYLFITECSALSCLFITECSVLSCVFILTYIPTLQSHSMSVQPLISQVSGCPTDVLRNRIVPVS